MMFKDSQVESLDKEANALETAPEDPAPPKAIPVFKDIVDPSCTWPVAEQLAAYIRDHRINPESIKWNEHVYSENTEPEATATPEKRTRGKRRHGRRFKISQQQSSSWTARLQHKRRHYNTQQGGPHQRLHQRPQPLRRTRQGKGGCRFYQRDKQTGCSKNQWMVYLKKYLTYHLPVI